VGGIARCVYAHAPRLSQGSMPSAAQLSCLSCSAGLLPHDPDIVRTCTQRGLDWAKASNLTVLCVWGDLPCSGLHVCVSYSVANQVYITHSTIWSGHMRSRTRPVRRGEKCSKTRLLQRRSRPSRRKSYCESEGSSCLYRTYCFLSRRLTPAIVGAGAFTRLLWPLRLVHNDMDKPNILEILRCQRFLADWTFS
jgi:hypothetical protein